MSAPVMIESLAAGGAGVAHLPDGMTVFVPRTAPGDRVALRDLRRHRRHAEAEIAELVEPGPDRVEPRCAHFARDRCGGCQWQHLPEVAQHAAKRRIVGDALRRIGRLDVPDPELVTGSAGFGYRATISLTVKATARGAVVGFHRAGAAGRVFPLDRCEIARPELNELWRALRPEVDALPRGDDVRVKLRVAADGSLHVFVDGGDRAWSGGDKLAEASHQAGLRATVWWRPTGGAARRLAGPEADPAAIAFEQVNPEVAALLRDAVVAAASSLAPRSSPLRILDLYAGAGETALPLAAAGHDVVMVELDQRAVVRAETRARHQGVALRCIAGRVEHWVARLLPADVVIVNPPRSGLAEPVARALTPGPRRLVYVSCDPATLARDLSRVGASPERLTVRAYDMFPQTSHVETVVVADLGAGDRGSGIGAPRPPTPDP